VTSFESAGEHPQDIATARKQVVLRVLAAIASKDKASASDCLADEVTWWVPQSAAEFGIDRPLLGRDPVLALLCGESRYEPGTIVWECDRLVHEDDVVIAQCTLRANTRAGQPYENQYCLVYRFDAELIVESWEHTDTAYAFARFSL
jgi:ketosteroid isomerase-like protein